MNAPVPLAGYKARHVRFTVDGKVATLTLDRPDKKNPLTFDSYAEIVDLFRAAAKDKQVKAIVVTKPGESVNPADVIAWARERIAAYKAPKSVDFIDALPRNPSGKVLRRELRKPYWEGRDRKVG